jgi:hypothetical protein
MMGQNLYELIRSRGIVAYPDDEIRLAVSRTISKETPRGYMLTKEKASHKIDVVIALAMAAQACVSEGQHAPAIVAPIVVTAPLGETRFDHPGFAGGSW